ncbi:hypothetical protein FPOAC1_011135 [Fusarium poae]|uniref:hypothetical protein n=1 Tax=Fusarium poae TaxID=36050 RepID=UPI001CE9A4A6|nr:hypothetical protein FPOAC1_011135 [Fusarium poae]KAG8666331.1 hypothetical protein FPOAC1_011135 [Fusarium poae]
MNLAMLITNFKQMLSWTVWKTWDNDWNEGILNAWIRQRRKDVNIATTRLLYIYQVFETSEGYLGAVDYQVVEGDHLYALAGYNKPVILRHNTNISYAFVE